MAWAQVVSVKLAREAVARLSFLLICGQVLAEQQQRQTDLQSSSLSLLEAGQ